MLVAEVGWRLVWRQHRATAHCYFIVACRCCYGQIFFHCVPHNLTKQFRAAGDKVRATHTAIE